MAAQGKGVRQHVDGGGACLFGRCMVGSGRCCQAQQARHAVIRRWCAPEALPQREEEQQLYRAHACLVPDQSLRRLPLASLLGQPCSWCAHKLNGHHGAATWQPSEHNTELGENGQVLLLMSGGSLTRRRAGRWSNAPAAWQMKWMHALARAQHCALHIMCGWSGASRCADASSWMLWCCSRGL